MFDLKVAFFLMLIGTVLILVIYYGHKWDKEETKPK